MIRSPPVLSTFVALPHFRLLYNRKSPVSQFIAQIKLHEVHVDVNLTWLPLSVPQGIKIASGILDFVPDKRSISQYAVRPVEQ